MHLMYCTAAALMITAAALCKTAALMEEGLLAKEELARAGDGEHQAGSSEQERGCGCRRLQNQQSLHLRGLVEGAPGCCTSSDEVQGSSNNEGGEVDLVNAAAVEKLPRPNQGSQIYNDVVQVIAERVK